MYPILEERRLETARRRHLFSSVRRETVELPDLPPRCAYVFQSAGIVEQFDDRQPIDLTHPAVTGGGTVSVVDLRTRVIEVKLPLPSGTPPERFTAVVEVQCRVDDARAVAADGVVDVRDQVKRYLLDDRDLEDITRQFSSDRAADAQVLVQDQVRARARVVPPRVSGMTLDLVSVQVQAPTTAEAHLTTLLNVVREGDVKDVAGRVQDAQVDRFLRLISRGYLGQVAVAVERGEMSMAEVARQTGHADEQALAGTLSVVVELVKQGHGAGSDFDLPSMLEALMGRITGVPADQSRRSLEDRSVGAVVGGPADSEQESPVRLAGDDDHD